MFPWQKYQASLFAIGCLLGTDCSMKGPDTFAQMDLQTPGDLATVAAADMTPVARWEVDSTIRPGDPQASWDWRGIWGSGPHDIWIVGAGPVLHGDGVTWAADARVSFLSAVGGSGPGDVWAVGNGNDGCQGGASVYHWNGAMWSLTLQHEGGLCAVWASGPNDVWIAGQDKDAYSEVLRWDGTALQDVPIQSHYLLTGLWGTGPEDVWTVGGFIGPSPRPGDVGRVAHWKGAGWSNGGGGSRFSALWGNGKGDIWAVHGSSSQIDRWDGSGKVTHPIPGAGASVAEFYTVWGSGPDDVWFGGGDGSSRVIYHWDGVAVTESWRSPPETRAGNPGILGIQGIWGSGPRDVWAVGDRDLILHYH